MASNNSEANTETYVPPKVWVYETSDGSPFTMNRPTAGAREQTELPKGNHDIQLYSMATPNGQKVTILLEELLELGISQAEYDAWPVNILKSDQFGSDFVDINPNSKIPAMRIYEDNDSGSATKTTTDLFESGSIMLHLAERFDNHALLGGSTNNKDVRTQVLNWLFWQMGSAPYLGGGFGHFYHYAEIKNKYAIDRFTMETKRQLDVLEKQLTKTGSYIAGDEYTIADISIFAWYGLLVLGDLYGTSKEFLNVEQDYPNVIRWAQRINERPAVQRGRLVNKWWDDDESRNVKERHSAADFDKTPYPVKK